MRVRLVCLLIGVGCAGTDTSTPIEPEKAVLRIGGTATMMEGLIPALVETHQSTRGTLAFQLAEPTEDHGFAELIAGELDLAAATRPAKPLETERSVTKGWSLQGENVRHLVGVDVTAVAVHEDNPLTSLTYDQVIGVFCTQSTDNWSFLGQDERPVHAMTVGVESGDRSLFEDFFCGPRGMHAGVEVATAAKIEEALRTDPSVITFASMSRKVGKYVALQPDPGGPPVEPSQQNIIRGSYPLYRDVYIFSQGEAAGYTRSFIDWIASPAGQEVVDERGLVPLFLRPERMDEPRPLRETIHFEPGRSVPNQRSMARLQLLVDELRERNIDHVVLEGFTDNRERGALRLSEQRANAVRELLSNELNDVYFEIIPRGATNALAPNDTPYGRLRNRRVQIYLAPDEQETPDDVVVESTKGKPNGG